jgi:predicted transcriptional regulator
MTTTTIRLGDELKARIAAAADSVGKTPHALMVEAIARTVAEIEEDRAFYRLADERRARLSETGLGVPWEEAKPWLEALARGERLPPPTPRKIVD